MSRNSDIDAARAYHRATSHTELKLRGESWGLDFPNQPIPFKLYPDLEPIPLPTEIASAGVPVLDGVGMPAEPPAAARPAERIPTLGDLARVLYLGAGVLRRKTYPNGEMFFRSYANTGALYHIDLYAVCGELPDLPAGVYHFSPQDFALRRLRAGDYRGVVVDASGAEPRVAQAPVVLVSASTYWRNAWKYRARTYRHCFWDTGTMYGNLLAAATTSGLWPRVVLGFADEPVEALLGLDRAREGALTLVPLGWSDAAPPAPPPMDPLALQTVPLSHHEIDYPPVREMHAASALETGAEAAAWRAVQFGARSAERADHERIPLSPLKTPPQETLEQVIIRRGSTRQFDPEFALTLEQLSAALRCATAPIDADFLSPAAPSLLELYLIVHSVAGLAPGAYHYDREAGALELLREGAFRSQAGRLGLFQHLPADAAVNIYSLTDLDAVLEAFGNRGYRAAQLEGGIQGGRMYLSAYAQRFGATGLTFLDDEVTEFFGPHAAGRSVMFLTALGRSIKRRSG